MVCSIRLRSRPGSALEPGAPKGNESVTEASVTIEDQPLGAISRRLYGHFAEQLGRCWYGGLSIGYEAGAAEAVDALRADVVAALRGLPAPLLRWPGGCHADHYRRRDGVGGIFHAANDTRHVTWVPNADSNAVGTGAMLPLPYAQRIRRRRAGCRQQSRPRLATIQATRIGCCRGVRPLTTRVSECAP
jgi:hypothetical protein